MRQFELYKTRLSVRRTKLVLKLLKKARSSQTLRLARALQIVREERKIFDYKRVSLEDEIAPKDWSHLGPESSVRNK